MVRAMIECSSLQEHTEILMNMTKKPLKETIKIVRVKQRYKTPAPGGWADLMINFFFVADPRKHVCELQVCHTRMKAQRSAGGHQDYIESRGASELLELIGKENRMEEIAFRLSKQLAEEGARIVG